MRHKAHTVVKWCCDTSDVLKIKMQIIAKLIRACIRGPRRVLTAEPKIIENFYCTPLLPFLPFPIHSLSCTFLLILSLLPLLPLPSPL